MRETSVGGREGEREGNHALRSRLIWTCSAQLEHLAFDMHPPPGAVLPSPSFCIFNRAWCPDNCNTQGRKEDGGYWASKWPSGLVTHLVCLINAHVMKLRRGKKLHGRSSNHAESQQQDNLINVFRIFPHTNIFKTFTDVTKTIRKS